MNEALHPRAIRSFVRAGRITDAQQRALDALWPRYGVEFDPRSASISMRCSGARAPRVVEIGFGNGENLAALAQAHPERDYLGIEVHRAGVGRLMLGAEGAAFKNLQRDLPRRRRSARRRSCPAGSMRGAGAVSRSVAEEAPSQAPADPAGIRGTRGKPALARRACCASRRTGSLTPSRCSKCWAPARSFRTLDPAARSSTPGLRNESSTRFEKRGDAARPRRVGPRVQSVLSESVAQSVDHELHGQRAEHDTEQAIRDVRAGDAEHPHERRREPHRARVSASTTTTHHQQPRNNSGWSTDAGPGRTTAGSWRARRARQ